MGWLLASGIVSFLAGTVFLFSEKGMSRLSIVLGQTVVYLDGSLNSIRVPLGVGLVVAGGWLISIAFSYASLWYLHIIGATSLFFGLLYLFLPNWLAVFSKIADQVLFSVDEVILGARKSFGAILIIAASYIFYAVYLSLK
jgi:hypothetical protein